jgi:diguanylate cyclase (GGDEF)-like protein/PAS domain S-box-containing protein
LYVNPRFAASFPGKQEHLLGSPFTQQPELTYENTFHSAIKQTVKSGEETAFEVEFASADGEIYTHLINMVPERDERNTIKGVLATGLDITERKQLEERLTAREREFRTLAENIPINISRFDKDGYLTYANSRLAADFPLTIDKLFGTQLTETPTQPYTEIVNTSIVRTLEDGVERSFEIEIPIPGGSFVTHLITMVAELDESGSIIGVLATGQNVSERKRLQRELERQARLDFLTGLLNRRYFMELAKMELLRLKRHGGRLSLIMFDIDHFKRINDSHGHNTGDLVLKKIANISHETVREIDVVGRLGGEEFVVLLPQTDKNQAFDIAERLRLAIADTKVKTETGTDISFTASFGIATIANKSVELNEAVTIDDLLILADQAMYQAKQNGRNQVRQ